MSHSPFTRGRGEGGDTQNEQEGLLLVAFFSAGKVW